MTEDENPLVMVVHGLRTGPCTFCEQLASDYRVREVPTLADAVKTLNSSERISLLLTDSQLPDGTGLQVLEEALGQWPPVPVVFVVDEGDDKVAAEALRGGAADYLTRNRTSELRLSQVLSSVLARSRAESMAGQRARELGVLNVILAGLNRAMDEEPVLDTIVHEVKALIGTDACSIILVDKETDQMFLRASTRLPVRDMVLPVPASKSIAGRIVREKKGCITADVTRDPEWHSLGLGYSVRSMTTVPLLIGGEAIGVLQAINKSVGPFLPSDLALLESIAAVAAVAIQRGQQYSASQETLEKLAKQAAEFGELGQAIVKQVVALEAETSSAVGSSRLNAIREQVEALLGLVTD